MIENKDKNLIKYLKSLFDGKADIMELLKEAQTDREKILALFLMSFGCHRTLGLDPKVMFEKMLKYKDISDIDKIVKKEYDKSVKEQHSDFTSILKEFIDKFSPEMGSSLDAEFESKNKNFIQQNSDKFVLVRDTENTPSKIEFYTDIDGAHEFDMDICFSKTFESFDEADKYRNKHNLTPSKIYSVEDCINFQ